jgi:hypothetical protein
LATIRATSHPSTKKSQTLVICSLRDQAMFSHGGVIIVLITDIRQAPSLSDPG